MRRLFVWLLLLGWWGGVGVSVLAAEPLKPEQVRAYASEVDARIAQMQASEDAARYGPFYCISVSINPHHRPWPAVGTYEVEYTFYFDREDGQDGSGEPKPYPDRLVKAICLRKVSARTVRQEFWFRNLQPVLRRTEQEGEKSDLLLLDSRSKEVREAHREAGEILKTFRVILAAP